MPNLESEISQWHVAQQAGIVNLKDLMNFFHKSFQCNKYYRIKLAVTNNCEPWIEATKLIYIRCPIMNDLPDINICCANLGTQPVVALGPISNYINPFTGLPSSPYNSVNWALTSGSGYFSPLPGPNQTSSNFTITGNATIAITTTERIFGPKPNVTYCSATQYVNVVLVDDFIVSIEQEKINCCNSKLTAKVSFPDGCNKWAGLSETERQNILNSLQFSWNSGETSQTISPTASAPYNYTCTVSIPPCYSHSASFAYTPSLGYSPTNQYTKILSANNALIAGSSGDFGKLYIIGSTYDSQGLLFPPLHSSQGIYGFDSLELLIFNRWGDLFRILSFADCGNLFQGDVFWDGTDNSGNYVQDGVYVFKIRIKTCGGPWLEKCGAQGASLTNGQCIKQCWGHIPGKPWWKFGWYCCTSYNGGGCAYAVTVIR
jgi:hypothetical protein